MELSLVSFIRQKNERIFFCHIELKIQCLQTCEVSVVVLQPFFEARTCHWRMMR